MLGAGTSLSGAGAACATRQPCPPCCSGRQAALAAPGMRQQRLRRGVQARAALAAPHESDYQQQPVFSPPAWHPRLYGVKSKRQQLEDAVGTWFGEVWNAANPQLLEDALVDDGVVYSDVLGLLEDRWGRGSLQEAVSDLCSTHPLLRFDVEDVIVDEERDTVVAHYTATAANLLPRRDGPPASGHVSSVKGMDKFRFNSRGCITSIQSFRQRFADEEVQLIDWENV